jgi:metallo-beta-lactamase family protein
MKIHFHGAAQTVTGSMHLIEINGCQLLLDCGLYQGRRKKAFEINRSFNFDPTKVDAVLLSHAHIDHSGNLPGLVKAGFDGPIYATPASAHLAELMMKDSGRIQEYDAAWVNKKRARRGEGPVEPLYREEDATAAASLLEPIEYERSFEPAPGVQVRFVEAGHILGSAAIVIDIESKNGASTLKKRLWFSGDIGRVDKPLLKDPVRPSETDILLMECTYGDKPHRDPVASYDELRKIVQRTVQRGGKVIIPSFAVGRTQELVYAFHQMIDAGDLPRIPVYVDSPLAVNVTDVFRKHRSNFDAQTQAFIAQDTHGAALGFDLLTYVRSVEESKALNKRKEPMVILSASGMAESGRILHHLRNNISDRRNTVLIASWQAPHTLGRRLADRDKQVKIFGEVFDRRCEIATIGGFSAHAGQIYLEKYAKAAMPRVQHVFLVHGEARGAKPLTELLNSAGIDNVHFPARGNSWSIE